jgi:VacB and RNase II family 3''-5'' exoribonucleases
MATKGKKNINKSKRQSKTASRALQEPVKVRGERRSKNVMEVEGVVSMSRDGNGFVKIDDPAVPKDLKLDDIFVPSRKMRGALHGDRVRVAIPKKKKVSTRRIEGEILAVVERSRRPHIGVLIVRGDKVWAMVESRNMPFDIRIPVESLEDLPTIGGIKAENGVKVAVLVESWPRKEMEPLGRIVDVLGKPGENETEMHSILAEFSLPYRFEPDVEEAANKISDVITESDIKSRRDMRGVTTFTIDPTDAKDFDDALSYKELENGHYEVGIHIADVTYYVTPGSRVDKEAFNRATSVYLVDRTIPMLPENLSNKLCSLRPHEDKLTYSAIFEMDDKAQVVSSWFGRTVINSDYRFDYEAAQDIIENQKGPLCKEILKLHELATILRKKRFDHGAVNFERPEMKVIVDKAGKPIDVVQKESKESNWLIEEFMLLANRNVAEYVAKKCKAKDPTFVYRVHDNPNPDKLEELRRFAHNFGHQMGDTANPKKAAASLNTLMGQVKDKPEENAVQMMALRSMARACYSTENIGHYGLAFDYYTHFTSPIRRYPDMMVHRLLTMYMDARNHRTSSITKIAANGLPSASR